MNALAILFALTVAGALLAVPRRWALLPLLIGSCYMTLGQGIQIGPFSFTVIRLLVAAGVIRVLVRGERPLGGLNGMDRLLLVWAGWAAVSSLFHEPPVDTLINRLGMVYNTLGLYFLVRCFIHSLEELVGLVKLLAILLVPVALEMLSEQFTGRNLFAELFGGQLEPSLRNDRLRSQGPFRHAIIAGTVGAVCAPLMIGIWRRHPLSAKIGLAACLLMVLSSASSGPVMSFLFSIFALVLWRWRHLTRQMRIAAVAGYLLLDLIMQAPAYFLIARIDITGSSTGWHRARLIESAFQRFHEWWLIGTDYTRHWMPSGVPWSPNHTDITNQYLRMGVDGGLLLMVLFIALMVAAFRYVGHALRNHQAAPVEDQFLIWALGASLFAHAATCMSVTYFDQSFVFLYSAIAMASSLRAMAVPTAETGAETPAEPSVSAPDAGMPPPFANGAPPHWR